MCILYFRNFDQLIPDAPELILNYLEGEQDASCKRNAFMMLTHVDRVSVSVRLMYECALYCVSVWIHTHATCMGAHISVCMCVSE